MPQQAVAVRVRVRELGEATEAACDEVDLPRLKCDEDRLGVPLVAVVAHEDALIGWFALEITP